MSREARFFRALALAAAVGSLGANYRTTNFVVSAPTPEIATQIGDAAEQYRRQLAVEWLGKEMRPWSQPCPITAHVGDQLGAGGATSFLFERGEVYGWRMNIQGSLVRILDSVLPHEVTHTVFATHFRQPLPRWADEGACTTVEHYSERAKQQTMLIDFLRTGRGIAFNKMFAMKEYPHDVMPLYSQGHSLACYLIAQGGKRQFLNYLSDGMRDENWTRATKQYFGFDNLAVLQNSWLDWVRRGSPAGNPQPNSTGPAATLAAAERRSRPEPNLIFRGQSEDGPVKTIPVARQDRSNLEETSVYSQARQAERTVEPQPASEWHVPASSAGHALPAQGSADDKTSAQSLRADSVEQFASVKETPQQPEPTQYAATRPQPVQKSRQVILEWSRPTLPASE